MATGSSWSSSGCSRCLEACGNEFVVEAQPPVIDVVQPQYGTPRDLTSMDKEMPPSATVSRVEKQGSDIHILMQQMTSDLDDTTGNRDKAGNLQEEPTKEVKSSNNAWARLDEHQVLDRSWWCTYCICGGCGCTEAFVPLRLDEKCICCLHTCESSECFNLDGCCLNMCSGCCLTWLCQCPPRKDTPRCVCCNTWCCGIHTGLLDPHRDDPRGRIEPTDTRDIPSYDVAIHHRFMLYYLCCCGCGISPHSFLQCMNINTKCMCCRCSTISRLPCGHEGCCTWVLTCGQCHTQCRIPCSCDHNPVCACCGYRLKPARKQRGAGISKPKQQEMK